MADDNDVYLKATNLEAEKGISAVYFDSLVNLYGSQSLISFFFHYTCKGISSKVAY